MNAILQPAPPDTPSSSAWPPVWRSGSVSDVADGLGTSVTPSPVPAPRWVAVSSGCAAELGWPADWATRDDAAALQVFAGNAQWPGMAPFASVYSGHQFGVWAGQLGDGRALSLGVVDTPVGPMELQLKGAGLTPYSRMGDGRAVLRSSIREFLCSEAMHALGIATTRALCVIGSPLPVRRERMETAAVVTRVAPSFLRFGHFEHFAAAGRTDVLRKLADHVIDQYDPACAASPSPYAALLEAVALRTADMIAAWQSVGFCHGVMNTDNMSLLGLTIDYGPFGFLDAFDPGHVCNHTDAQGRYAFDQQPAVGFWNLHALARAMRPLIGEADAARQAIEPYKARYAAAYDTRMRRKLGLDDVPHEGDAALVRDWLQAMADGSVDHTIAFRRLADHGTDAPTRDLFLDRAGFDAWALRYERRLQHQADDAVARRRGMQAVNPRVVLRNHLAETAIQRAEQGDFTEVTTLLDALVHPFEAERPLDARYTGFVPDWADHLEVSCSS